MQNVARKYNKDGLIAILILILPFFIYAHLLFSRDKSQLIIFDYSFSHRFNNNEAFIWFFLNDLVPFSLLLMMFSTTTKKWKYFLFPLLASYFLALLYVLNVFPSLKEAILSTKAMILSIILVVGLVGFDHFIARKYRQMSIYVNLQFLLRSEYKINIKLIQSKLNSLHEEKYSLSLKHYFKKLYYLHLILDKNLKNIYYSIKNVRSKNKTSVDLVLILSIILMTFVWYLPYLLPKEIMNIKILGFTVESNGFIDVRTFLWFVARKIVVIIFLSIWFITSEHWWKYAIFSPLIIFSYQFWEAFQDVSVLEAMGNLNVFPLVLLNILAVAAISRWIKYKTDLLLIYEVICKEVEDLLDELKGEHVNEITKKYKEIKDGHPDRDVDYYKAKLKELEQELLLKLDLMKR